LPLKKDKNKLSTQDVFVGLCVDMSGSMNRYVKDTTGGVDALVAEQAKVEGSCKVSITVFDTVVERNIVAREASEVPKLGTTGNPYRPRGSTALFDAVGATISDTDKWLMDNPDFKGDVLIAIVTDGYENASKEWKIYPEGQLVESGPANLGELIKVRKDEGWNFLFMGAGGDEWLSKTFSQWSGADSTMGFNADDSAQVYGAVSKTVAASRQKGGGQYSNAAVAAAATDAGVKDVTHKTDDAS
jgi:hypothetical protein